MRLIQKKIQKFFIKPKTRNEKKVENHHRLFLSGEKPFYTLKAEKDPYRKYGRRFTKIKSEVLL